MNSQSDMKKTIILLMLCVASSLLAQTNNVRYFYDDAGQLTKVVDPSGNIATYSYDAAGNLLQITRSSVAGNALAVLNISPYQGGIGSTVTIQGQGFSASPAQNTVFFSGTQASVVSATNSALVVTVPVGATTGPVSVTVNTQTATSDTNFTVFQAPTVLAIHPRSVLQSPTANTIANFSVSGANLNGAKFSFLPAVSPVAIAVNSAAVDPTGTSATLSITVGANVAGTFTLVAANSSGSSNQVPSSTNTLHVLDPNRDDDNDGLTNAVEIALGTDPLNPSTINDGITDGWKVFYGFSPLDPNVASEDSDGDGLTNLQEFQQGTNPRNPNTVPPAVSQIFPANNATSFLINGKIVVRFTEPLLTGVSLSSAQTAIILAAPSLPVTQSIPAAQALQNYLQRTCCANSVVPGVVTLQQASGTVNGTAQISNDGLSLTFTPAQQLAPTTAYTVQVNGVRDLAGNRMTQPFQSSFTTGLAADAVPPKVLKTSPADGDSNIPTNAALIVQFSKVMDPASLTPNSFSITDTFTGQQVTGSVQVDATAFTAAFVPNPPLPVNRTFVANLSSNVTDSFGNSLPFTSFRFTTTFGPDTDAPHLLGTSPTNGATNVPTNVLILLSFNETLNVLDATSGIQVSTGGQVVPGAIALSNANRLITFTPASPLTPDASYTITISSGITDLAGHLIDNAGSISFQTGAGADKTPPQVLSVSPADGVSGVPVNTVVEAQFSKPMDILTINTATVQVIPFGGSPIAGAVAVSADGETVTFTPAAPLSPLTSYQVRLKSGINDLVGQNAGFLQIFDVVTSFTTGTLTQSGGPQVLAVSPQNGSAGNPLNAAVVVALNEPIEPLSVNNGAITISTGGTPVAGAVSISSDRTKLTFIPASPLLPTSSYTVTVQGFTDVAGNPAVPFSSTFATATAADNTALQVITVNPADRSTGVPVNTKIVLTFNKAVDPTTVNSNSIPIQASGANVAGSFAVNGATVTFTPLGGLPGNTQMRVFVQNPLRDAAGNGTNFFASSFTTSAVADTTAPQVLAVTPSDGATNIGLNATVALTFSKSLNPATVNNSTFGLLSNSGIPLNAGISISADNRTVMLNANSLPASSTVTVVATSGVRDLSGNALADFRSQFTTTTSFDVSHASVINQRPGNGASGGSLNSSIVLFVNEGLDPSTLVNALHISQNGTLVQGTITTKDHGQTIEFVPTTPWTNNALILVVLDSSALDVDGSPVNSYQGSFRTVVDTSTVAPSVVSTVPSGFFITNVLQNATLEILYNEVLNPNTVNLNTVLLENLSTGQFVAGTVTLDAAGTLIRFAPNVPLAANTSYQFETTGAIAGLNGLNQGSARFVGFFTTGTSSDSTPPVVTLVSPPDGSAAVPVNAQIHVRFNKPINPLTVNANTIQVNGGGQRAVDSSISFSNNNQDVVLTPQEPFVDNTMMTVTVTGVEDLAGNAVLAKSTQFLTGAGPATSTPLVQTTNPFDGATDVPVNTLITAHANVPIDPGTVNSNSFQVVDRLTNQVVAGNYSVSADGQTFSFVPNAPLAVSRNYRVFAGGGMTDLAGNPATCTGGFICPVFGSVNFTTSTVADTVGPKVVGVSPPDQLTGVPTNTQVVVQFDEPVDPASIGKITLSAGGTPVSVVPVLSNGQTTLVLTPAIPLNASTPYSLSISGVQDISGNAINAPVTSSFTTGTGADLLRPQVSAVSPVDGATGVPVNTVIEAQFNKRMDALTITPATFQVIPFGGSPIAGTVVVSTDGQSATFTPSAPLQGSTSYQVRLKIGMTDLIGQNFGFLGIFDFTSSFTTGSTTGP